MSFNAYGNAGEGWWGRGHHGRRGHHGHHHEEHVRQFARKARKLARYLAQGCEAAGVAAEAAAEAGADAAQAAGEAAEQMGMRFGHHRGGFFGGWGHGHHGFPPMPPGFPFGPQGRRGQRVKRGDVRAAILTLLGEQPRNGYQLIQEIAERSGGVWKPSPGAIYPALQQLEDEGLIRSEDSEGKRVFALTEAGRTYLAERPEEASPPWAGLANEVPDDLAEIQALLGQVMGAGMQVAQVASDAQLEKAKQILSQARRSLYQILAEEE